MRSDLSYDVIVVGGGPAGFAAACGAAAAGGTVLLVEQSAAPGGIAVFSGCPVLAGIGTPGQTVYGGVTDTLTARLADGGWADMVGGNLTSTEAAIQLTMSRMLREAGVDLLFYATVTGVTVEGRQITAVQAHCAGQQLNLRGRCFVDASGDARLSRLAGTPVRLAAADEAMTRTLLFRVSGVSHFDKPSLKKRFAEKKFPLSHQDCFMGTTLPDGTVLLNLTAVSGDVFDPADLTRMDLELREQVFLVLEWLRREFAEFADCRLVSVAPVIGVRCAGTMVGRECITCRDLAEGSAVSEPVALGRRRYGDHYIDGFNSPWKSDHPGYRPIPYGALISAALDNVLAAGRCLSIEPRACTAVRLIPNCLASGQAAGAAAALRLPAWPRLAAELLRQGCHLALPELPVTADATLRAGQLAPA